MKYPNCSKCVTKELTYALYTPDSISHDDEGNAIDPPTYCNIAFPCGELIIGEPYPLGGIPQEILDGDVECPEFYDYEEFIAYPEKLKRERTNEQR